MHVECTEFGTFTKSEFIAPNIRVLLLTTDIWHHYTHLRPIYLVKSTFVHSTCLVLLVVH